MARDLLFRVAMKMKLLHAIWIALAAGACSTSYTPQRTDRAYLVVQTSKMALSKNGQVVAEDAPFGMLLQCDQNAQTTANTAQSNIQSGRNLLTIAAVLNVLVGPGNLIGIPLMFMGANDISTGYAGMVDALNRHNDATSCTQHASR